MSLAMQVAVINHPTLKQSEVQMTESRRFRTQQGIESGDEENNRHVNTKPIERKDAMIRQLEWERTEALQQSQHKDIELKQTQEQVGALTSLMKKTLQTLEELLEKSQQAYQTLSKLEFDMVNGDIVTIKHDGLVAERLDRRWDIWYREDPAIAFTNRPLTVYEHFEVEIISTRLSSGQWHGVLAIGVVTHSHLDLQYGMYMLNTWGNTYVNGSFNSTLVSPTVLRSMTTGDRLGLMITPERDLVFFINGRRVGVGISGIPSGTLGFVKLWNSTSVKIIPHNKEQAMHGITEGLQQQIHSLKGAGINPRVITPDQTSLLILAAKNVTSKNSANRKLKADTVSLESKNDLPHVLLKKVPSSDRRNGKISLDSLRVALSCVICKETVCCYNEPIVPPCCNAILACKECLEGWLRVSSTCPYCRSPGVRSADCRPFPAIRPLISLVEDENP